MRRAKARALDVMLEAGILPPREELEELPEELGKPLLEKATKLAILTGQKF